MRVCYTCNVLDVSCDFAILANAGCGMLLPLFFSSFCLSCCLCLLVVFVIVCYFFTNRSIEE